MHYWLVVPDPDRFGTIHAQTLEVVAGALVFKTWAMAPGGGGTTGALVVKLIIARGSWLHVSLVE